MNILEKAKILTEAGSYDSCGPKQCEVNLKEGLGGIYYAKAENKNCKIFKTLMSNTCAYDCKYCGNTCSKKKVMYEPRELATLFNHVHKNMKVDGLFLTSGVHKDADFMTEKMIESVKILRNEFHYTGYVHFKVLPGASYDLIKQASEISNRMSINIEAPNSSVMSELSSCKNYKTDILRRQAWVSRLNLRSGQTTQMIVNRHSKDKDVLRMMEWEYKNIQLKRMYFSAFRPVEGTKMQNEKAEPMSRQNHLYNVDFLIRCYGYEYKEFVNVMDDGMLPNEDPKVAIARQIFDKPVDINKSSYEELLRVPGIGPVTASRIFEKKGSIRSFADLDNLGVTLERAKPFVSIDGRRQCSLMEF